jgi:hypothetical protein
MAEYCYWVGEPGGVEGSYICIGIDEIVIPPELPDEGETDPDAEITLPDGTSVAATATAPPLVGLKEMAWHGEPWNTLWGVRTDGLLVGMTYDKDEDVWGWHRHPMNNGAVISACVIPSSSDEQNECWVMVRRTINSATKHYIERMTARIQPEDENDKDRYNFLDSSIAYSGSAVTSFTGAAHLAGQSCRVWGDGVDLGDVTVSALGAFTIPVASAKVVIGIQTDATMISLPTARLSTERQIVSEVIVRFFETLGGKAGNLNGQMDTLQFRTPGTPMDDSPPLWDGDMKVKVGGKHDDVGVYTITQDTAGPMTILATFPSYKAA